MDEKKSLEQIAAFVRGKRGEKDINQTELAERANVSLRSVVSIENATKVRSSTLDKVLAGLGYEIEIAMTFKEIEK